MEGEWNLIIGVVSDSHGDRRALEKALRHMGKVDVVFHLGDYVKDVSSIKTVYPGPVYNVKGNCDFFIGTMAPSEQRVTLGGKTVFAVHGHKYNVKSGIKTLYYKGLEIGADIVLFGHTHCAGIIRVDDMVFLNPGSVSCPRDGKPPTYGIIEISKGHIKPKIVNFSGGK